MDATHREDRYIRPGTKVRHDGFTEAEGGPEYGVVVHCWEDSQTGLHNCYVAFFGSELPSGKPDEKPYVLHYATGSLSIIDE